MPEQRYGDGYYTLKDVELYFGLDNATLRRWAHSGALRAQKRQVSGVTMKVWTITELQFNEAIPTLIKSHWKSFHFRTRERIFDKFPLILTAAQMEEHQSERVEDGRL